MERISPQTYVRRVTEGLLYRVIDQEAIIIKLDSGAFHVLNRVGTAIWELADGQRTVAEIASAICREYDVAPETALQDALELLDGLVERGLVTVIGERDD